jgi:cytoskeletal protein RodZ
VSDHFSERQNPPSRRDWAALRRSKGISLDQIVEATKISKRFLEAIEQGDLRTLPGGIFQISYLRQYARAIDVSETELLEYYNLTAGPPVENGSGIQLERKPPSKILRSLGIAARS